MTKPPELDPETKARIEAEEAYRAQVQAMLDAKAKNAEPKSGLGRFTGALIAFIGFVIFGVIPILRNTSASRESPLTPGTQPIVSGLEVSAANVDPWPLTFPSGYLSCDRYMVTVTRPDGLVVAINGPATVKAAENGWVPLDESVFWKEGDASPKENIGPLIQQGLSLCE